MDEWIKLQRLLDIGYEIITVEGIRAQQLESHEYLYLYDRMRNCGEWWALIRRSRRRGRDRVMAHYTSTNIQELINKVHKQEFPGITRKVI